MAQYLIQTQKALFCITDRY